MRIPGPAGKGIIPGFILMSLCLGPMPHAANTDMIIPGGDWRDTDGNLVYATEGGFLGIGDTFYLWGMDRSKNNSTFEAINLYSSTDFRNWKFVNKILTGSSHPDIDNGAVVERAKILHNTKTGQFVIWMHYEDHNAYSVAEVAYATCATIGGDYTFREHFRPGGIDSRDLNVYKDDDGKAYLICTTDGNQSVRLFELDETYTAIAREVYRGYAGDDMECEGHGIIRTGGYYFWLMSWCSGWDFNENHYYYSKTLGGPWAKGGNIAVTNTHTYESQVGFSFTLKGSETTSFIYMGDRWAVRNFSTSRLVVLPIEVSGTTLKVPWHDQWSIDPGTGKWHAGARNFIDGEYTITVRHSGLALGIGSGSSEITQEQPSGASTQLWRIENRGASHFRITSVSSGKCFDVSDESREAGAKVLQYEWKDSFNQKWHIVDCGEGYHRFIAVNTLGKTLEIQDASASAGVPAVLGDFSRKDHQLFRITAVKSGIVSGKNHRLVNRASGRSFGVRPGASPTIVQEEPAATAVQVWKVVDLFNGYYSLTNLATGSGLDNGGSTTAGSPVVAMDSIGGFTQQWQAVVAETGYFILINRYSGMVLKGGSGSEVSVVQDIHGTDEIRQWRFELEEKVENSARGSVIRMRFPDSGAGEPVLFDMRGRVSGKRRELPAHAHGIYIMRRPGAGNGIVTVFIAELRVDR